MKRVISVLLICIILISFISLVIAQDNSLEGDDGNTDSIEDQVDTEIQEEIDPVTQDEVEEMDNSYGARMRLLQLERQMRLKVMHMQVVIDVLDNKSTDTTNLSAIVEEMNILIDEIQALPDNYEGQDAVDSFVQIKEDSRDLVKRFRDTARPLLTSEDIEIIREEISDIDTTELDNLSNQIQEERSMRNAEKVKEILEIMGVEDDDLVEQVKNGELFSEEVSKALRDHYNNLDEDKKEEVSQELKDNFRNRIYDLQDKISKSRIKMLENAENRLQDRAKILEEKGYKIASNNLERKADRYETRSDEIARRRTIINNRIRTLRE